MGYEDLFEEAEKQGIRLFENNFIGKLKGLYTDNTITINASIETNAEKKCILAEELGHYCTSYGDILDQSNIKNRKQEKRARGWAYQRLASIKDLIRAFKNGCQNMYEIAEYLDVSEPFLKEAIDYYYEKYGYYETNDYIIYFSPLEIIKK
ncbi:ImmA/IrrE family metallo-endopeptidase [Sporanaerobacter sp. PP17-6a]|uniref:ImmA/IrrE family metallo-endopeptidase n=1 Tax=Sporanaerobacter sp. PP17-6a TaxID=1891289 RepID=UPI0008A08A1B|nr:ImmA/IrrE family metallo-endopeptidase [Sporanaerobacter sp. PP17-6a]SCL87899.1 hypothetical protein PP176A_1415 [Sporanaerobacter sp. PP17-6a]